MTVNLMHCLRRAGCVRTWISCATLRPPVCFLTIPPGTASNGRGVVGAGLLLLGAAGGLAVYHFRLHQTAACTQKQEKRVRAGHVIQGLPEFSLKDVAKHKTKETGIWVTFGDGVYDITEFLHQHPGGSDKIILAAGSSIEPYWAVFGAHNTDEVREILEELRTGNIALEDRGKKTTTKREGPYANDPERSPVLKVNTREPFNAETPPLLLTESFLTPNDIFFVRNHLPVPQVNAESYVLKISGEGMDSVNLSLNDLKTKFPKHTVTVTIQCAGNRRMDLANMKPVKGIPWTGGAIGNAQWSGAYLRDVLLSAGLRLESGVQHIHIEGLDTNPLTGEHYGASIPIEKAMDPRGDCLLAYEMNGGEIPRDHGYPVRAIVPGIVGARNVKWLGRIVASKEEYGGFWQQRDYKGFSPSVNWDTVDFSSAPAIQELPVQSLICLPQDGTVVPEGEEDLTLSGIAWSGGGRAIIRVDVSVDGGRSWHVADLNEGTQQERGKAWAWTFWNATVPLPPHRGELEVCCKAVDLSYNVQPDTSAPIWNLRGCLSNAWHRIHITTSRNSSVVEAQGQVH